MTLTDIISELSKPGRDPREDMPKPILRQDVLKLEDLKEGMILTGTVRNVIDFGAFVDIGVKYDGLVHISEMSDKYIKNPSEEVIRYLLDNYYSDEEIMQGLLDNIGKKGYNKLPDEDKLKLDKLSLF